MFAGSDPVVRSDETNAESPKFESIEAAFAALESPLLGYACRLLSDTEMAEDMVQESFLRLHRQFGEVRDPRRWLYRTVHNLALNHRRKTDRLVPFAAPSANPAVDPAPDLDPTDPLPLPDEQIAREEGIGQVRLGLETLDERSRTILRLKFEEDLSYKEISAKLGLTVGHVGYLIHHAVKALAVELERNGVMR